MNNCGVEKRSSHLAHTQEVAGSSPASATNSREIAAEGPYPFSPTRRLCAGMAERINWKKGLTTENTDSAEKKNINNRGSR